MISYTTVKRGYPNDPALHALLLLDRGRDTTGNETVLIFGGAKPITRVPMCYSLNGPADRLLGYGIYTDQMGDCEAICVVGVDGNRMPQWVGFTHVRGGDPGETNWDHLMSGMNNCAEIYCVMTTSRMNSADSYLYKHMIENQLVPDNRILIYNYGSDHARGGKTFGVNELQEFGELDPDRLVERNDHLNLNNDLQQYFLVNPQYPTSDTHWAMKKKS